ncbi:MAG TPA: hypothetical protein VFS08_04980 [Gemmatimonadaceae bacterium]|nr:hypothetical protein [Gemmatimonadaceae bacterium]
MRAAVAAVVVATACVEGPAAESRAVPGGDAALGRAALERYGCGACHLVPGVRAARGMTGPPLTDFAHRAYVAGALPNEPDALVRWIMHPQAVEPGTVMPDLGVSEADARHIAAYLYTLGGEPGPPRLLPVDWLEGN